jgi:uncharacterized protein
MQSAELTDSQCRATWTSRSGDFVSLMTLYESNYIRLQHLLGTLTSLPDRQISRTKDDCDLFAFVVERSRYTTTFTLTYRFVVEESVVDDPDLQVRIYHDAHLAEALRCERWRHPVFSALHTSQHKSLRTLDDRWQRNIMLNKWLDYCLERGHHFRGVADIEPQRP